MLLLDYLNMKYRKWYRNTVLTLSLKFQHRDNPNIYNILSVADSVAAVVVLLFWVLENCKSALSKKTDHIDPQAVIRHRGLKGSRHTDIAAELGEGVPLTARWRCGLINANMAKRAQKKTTVLKGSHHHHKVDHWQAPWHDLIKE